MTCEHCNEPEKGPSSGVNCCWERAMKIKRFKRRVKYKYIIEVAFDLIISVTSVATDFISLFMYFSKRRWVFAFLTLIPILLPTFVFTNVYLADDSKKKRPISTVASITQNTGAGSLHSSVKTGMTSRGRTMYVFTDSASRLEEVHDDETDSSINNLPLEESRKTKWEKFMFHCPACFEPVTNWTNCIRGCAQCFCNRDLNLRRKGAHAMKRSMKRMFKYGFGTCILRFIGWAWYIKAIIYGIKAYREPKRYMKIETPDNHWSYELLIRLDFLQAALENAPQCVVQLYALITEREEDKYIGLLTLFFSFVDFIRVSISVHWDMDKGPVIAPSGCYNTWLWRSVNTISWIFIYSARSAAIALILATSGLTEPTTIFPAGMLVLHIVIFTKVLSKAKYGVAAEKIFIAVFISLFFLPELDSNVLPTIVQFYYATIIIQNAFFIFPWDGFDKEYCVTSGEIISRPPRPPTTPKPWGGVRPNGSVTSTTFGGVITTFIPMFAPGDNLTTTPITEGPEETDNDGCLIDPVIITLAVPTLTVIGVIFRLAASKKMLSYKRDLPNRVRSGETQTKLETSIANLFSKKWTKMSVREMISAFLKMLKKEVIIHNKSYESEEVESDTKNGIGKRQSFLAARLQAEFLASQTFIRESFSLMTRTTRSHDIVIRQLEKNLEEDEPSLEYNSDSELTMRNRSVKKRPRIPRSRNVSESLEVPVQQGIETVQMDLPSGTQFLEMCWI